VNTVDIMSGPVRLPSGYAARPVTLADAELAADLKNAYNIALTGKPSISAGEIKSEWGQASGMRVERQYDFYEKELRPGEDLSTRELA
jgi:hypothetical protein